jgi:hypothetical protein
MAREPEATATAGLVVVRTREFDLRHSAASAVLWHCVLDLHVAMTINDWKLSAKFGGKTCSVDE